jgi:hypothetical protein
LTFAGALRGGTGRERRSERQYYDKTDRFAFAMSSILFVRGHPKGRKSGQPSGPEGARAGIKAKFRPVRQDWQSVAYKPCCFCFFSRRGVGRLTVNEMTYFVTRPRAFDRILFPVDLELARRSDNVDVASASSSR